MLKIFSFFIFLSSLQCHSFAQPPVDYKKLAEDANKKAAELQNDPKFKAAIEQAQKMKAQSTTISKSDSLNLRRQTGVNRTKTNDSTNFSLPSRNETYLHALPIRTFTRAELVSYLHNINSKLTELLRATFGTDINNIPISSVTEGSETGVALWLNSKQDESALVVLKAAEMNPDNDPVLNNVGGILTNFGLGVNAIPVLQYILDKDPTNNTILNNIGQAYLALGDTKTAEHYLLQCVKDSKYHPDANLALGYINKARGNKADALKYTENSLRGAFSIPAYNLLGVLKPDAKLMDYIRHRYKQPEYFNFDKYPLLPQCRDTKYTPILRPQYAAYKEMLAAIKKKYAALRKQQDEISRKTVTEKMMNDVKKNKSPFRPFGVFANVVLTDLAANEYNDRFLRFAEYKNEYLAKREKFNTDYLAEINAINEQYKLKKEDVSERDGEGSDGTEYDELNGTICGVKETVKNRYLNLYADAIEAYQQKALHLYKDYFNDMAFWYYVGSVNDDQYKAEFYGLVSQFLEVLTEINTTHFYNPCQPVENAKGYAKEIALEDPECYLPQPLKIPLGIVSLDISCQEYKVDAGEGFIFNGTYNRLSGETTLAFGPGVKVPDMPKFSYMGAEVETGAKVSGQAFIKFNNDGVPLDWGLIWTGKIDLKVKAFGMGKSVSDNEVVTVGYNSGVQMKDGGIVKSIIDKMCYVQPEAKQINKNIPLYRK